MYGHSLSCDYTITEERGMVVSLAFTQFNLEDSSRCSYDWLEVIDGPSQQDTSLGKYCGSSLPGNNGTIISSRYSRSKFK